MAARAANVERSPQPHVVPCCRAGDSVSMDAPPARCHAAGVGTPPAPLSMHAGGGEGTTGAAPSRSQRPHPSCPHLVIIPSWTPRL